MAVTVTPVLAGQTSHVSDVEATADADTTATVPHGLGVAPSIVILTHRAAEARISDWIATTIDATNVVCLKTTTAGSGAAGVQLRVAAMRPHSLIS